MTTEAFAIDMTGAREAYKLLDELDRHINSHDANGRALLYQVKERIRTLIVRLDRANSE
jgi:hypothetical protein